MKHSSSRRQPMPGSRRSQGPIRGMKGEPKKILKTLIRNEWTILRQRKHLVLKHPDHPQIVLPLTSSDHRSAMAALATIRHVTGIDLKALMQGREQA